MDDTKNLKQPTQRPPLRTGEPVKPDDPLDTPLPCEVVIGNMRFGQGVSLRTLVDAAGRWLKEAQRMRLEMRLGCQVQRVGLAAEAYAVQAVENKERAEAMVEAARAFPAYDAADKK